MKVIDKYLSVYAEQEVTELQQFPSSETFEQVIVIPAYEETDDFYQRFLRSSLVHQSVLFIIVINQPETVVINQPETISEPNQVKQATYAEESKQLKLWNTLLAETEQLWQSQKLRLQQIANCNSCLLLVDRFSKNFQIPIKQGVGLARKIGTDLAVWLYRHKHIHSPFIGSTDADATLPDNYFSARPQHPSISIMHYNFKHVSNFGHSIQNDATGKATQLYEKALHYYVAGLSYAGSSYNFYTIGSILAFNAHHYSQARGFPKRSAGEDFYLINKLAKLGKVKNIKNSQILIQSRVSDRVPFGTGPAVEKILELESHQDYLYYHPQLFVELKQTLEAFLVLFFDTINAKSADLNFLDNWSNKLSTPSQDALIAMNFFQVIEKLLKNNNNKTHFDRQINEWFDAFRTLKFLHYIRQHHFQDIPLLEAINNSFFTTD